MRVNDRGTNGEERAGIQTADAKFGSLKLVSAPEIEAGELACVTLRYVAGDAGLTPCGTLTIYTDSDSDWAPPQLGDSCADLVMPSLLTDCHHRQACQLSDAAYDRRVVSVTAVSVQFDEVGEHHFHEVSRGRAGVIPG